MNRAALWGNWNGYDIFSRKSQCHRVAAVYAKHQMLEDAVALCQRERLLGKSSQEVRVWVIWLSRVCGRQTLIEGSGPEAIVYDFWYFSHL